MVANSLLTGLIVYKILSVYRSIDKTIYGNGPRHLYPLISILVESGMITFVAQLLQSILYKVNFVVYGVISGPVVMLYVRASRRLLIWCFDHILYYTGDFDDTCSCACRLGRFLRSSPIKTSEFVALHTSSTILIDPQPDHQRRCGRRSEQLAFNFRDEAHAKCITSILVHFGSICVQMYT